MNSSKPFWQWSACDLATAIRRQEITSEEVVRSTLSRMDEVNPHLNAIVVSMAEHAITAAKAADIAVRSGKSLGLLHGVPVTSKINTDVKGVANSNGVIALADNIAPDDAPVTRNLRKAGAVIIGMTNCPELSFRAVTDNPLHGLTRNPWHDHFTCGGSSGGAASAVAAGMGPIAQGNDMGGSLRQPALCCGVSTIRPTMGRIPAFNPSQLEERSISAQLLSTHGPIAREVRDVRLALEVMSAYSPYDPWWVPAPLEGPPIDHPIRVAVTRKLAYGKVHPVIAEAIDRAADYLAAAGYEVVDVDAPFTEELYQTWPSLLISEVQQLQEEFIKKTCSAELNGFFEGLYAHTKILDKASYMRALARRTGLIREWLLFLEDYPLVLAPLSLVPTFPNNIDLGGVDAAGEIINALAPSFSVNVLGLPSITAPIGIDEGLPYGVQIISRRFREDLCLNAAEEIEKVVGVLPEQLW